MKNEPISPMENLGKLENRLWDAADQLRANSNLNSNEYFMPVMGLIFLRHAYNRFLKVKAEIEPTLPSRGGVTRALTKEDFAKKSALFLRKESQFDYLLELPESEDKGQAIIEAMEAIEEDYENLAGVLPKNYQRLGSDILQNILKTFNDEALRNADGDVFGRIYEYFLMKFAINQAQDDGEFFTPVSLVQTIVNVIEPDHGAVFDPACGSGGMFVQSSHFIEDEGKRTNEVVTFYGQEKSPTTIRLAKMNLAVHGLEGNIVEGNTFYEDQHDMLGKADFVMANPPFNVNGVDSEKVKTDKRLPFGLPGVNQKKEVSNGNYLWISYFYSCLNERGRAGFVMSSQASSAGHGEQKVRQKIVETGDVDVMIAIGSNFFYTRSVPCELWFFDKGKPEHLKDKVLMIDARNIYRKVSRKINDFTPEQLHNISAIVWLYRGETEKYLNLVSSYFDKINQECQALPQKIAEFDKNSEWLTQQVEKFSRAVTGSNGFVSDNFKSFESAQKELQEAFDFYQDDKSALVEALEVYTRSFTQPQSNEQQLQAWKEFEPLSEKVKGISKQIDLIYKLLNRVIEIAEKDLEARSNDSWNTREVNKYRKDLEQSRDDVVEQLHLANYYYRQIHWLQSRFPDAKLVDVDGLVKLVEINDIKEEDWSLTPGRYVGVALQEEDEDFDFEEAMGDIHRELFELNEESISIAKLIQTNFEKYIL